MTLLDRPPTLEEAIAMLKDAIADVDEKIEKAAQERNEAVQRIIQSGPAPAYDWERMQRMDIDQVYRRFGGEMEPMLQMREYLLKKLVNVMPMSPIIMANMEL